MTRPTGVFKQTNAYVDALTPGYADTPKAVYAALAYSLALRMSDDDHDKAAALLGEEWAALHANGIVPQKPSKAGAR